MKKRKANLKKRKENRKVTKKIQKRKLVKKNEEWDSDSDDDEDGLGLHGEHLGGSLTHGSQ